ncbi:MAG: four helix bundle protein [Deltaproteobacteria bacterium]|nr:four helix bundle protein [Deltaproteobacteria bacterium]
MSTFKSFEEIEAWQKARKLSREVYAITRREPFSQDFHLRSQILKSSISVMSNIAEGFERGGTREFQQFLTIAKGSAGETLSHLYVALDRGYITGDVFGMLHAKSIDVIRMLGGLIRYLKKSQLKGYKFK